MSRLGIDALKAIVAAYEMRRLYGTDHIRWTDCLGRCDHACAQALGQDASITIITTADGTVVNRETVHEPWARNASFLRKLTARGIGAVRISRGAARKDFEWLMEALDSTDLGASPSGRIVLGQVNAADQLAPAASPAAAGKRPQASATADAGAARQAPPRASLRTVWSHLVAGEHADDSVGLLVNRIHAATVGNRASLIKLADLKSHDEYTFVHVTNVAMLASALAESAGLGGEQLRRLTEAALLHDIGKWTLARELLIKPGALSDEERKAMQIHPVTGAKILAATPGVSELAIVAAFEHHQRIDGKGYPALAAGRRPSLLSQIVHVADVFDALRSDRPYRAGMPMEKVLELMAKDAGAAFDAELFNVFQQRVLNRVAEAPPASLPEQLERKAA